MIKNGAKLVDCIDDILEEWNLTYDSNERMPVDNKANEDLNNEERSILACLKQKNCHINELIGQIKLPPSDIIASITMLEIKGFIKQIDGTYYLKLS